MANLSSLQNDASLFFPVGIEGDAYQSHRVSVGMRLGASLYIPITRAADITRAQELAGVGVTSLILCLEDSVPEHDSVSSLRLLGIALESLRSLETAPPLTFIRPRSLTQLHHIVERFDLSGLSGVAVPKFEPVQASSWLDCIASVNVQGGTRLLAMPILESRSMANDSDRGPWLRDCHQALEPYTEFICALRIGLVDIGGSIGLRRSAAQCAYDLVPLANAVAGVVGEFAGSPIAPVVTGGAWEFLPPSRNFPVGHAWGDNSPRSLRCEAGTEALSSFTRELVLDRAHGLVGKSVIHPSQAAYVQAMLPITHEEMVDATAVLGSNGATRSPYNNKMNESAPHRAWAERTLRRGAFWGVLAPGIDSNSLLPYLASRAV